LPIERVKSTILADSAQHKAKIGAKMIKRNFALPWKGIQSASSLAFYAIAISLKKG